MKIIYYDVTNYYFEIDSADEMRKYGKCKQNRKKPIVQMGLAMDSDGIPIYYEIFPGNKLDDENLYLFDYRNEISEAIGDALDIDFTRIRLRLGEIKKILDDTKK